MKEQEVQSKNTRWVLFCFVFAVLLVYASGCVTVIRTTRLNENIRLFAMIISNQKKLIRFLKQDQVLLRKEIHQQQQKIDYLRNVLLQKEEPRTRRPPSREKTTLTPTLETFFREYKRTQKQCMARMDEVKRLIQKHDQWEIAYKKWSILQRRYENIGSLTQHQKGSQPQTGGLKQLAIALLEQYKKLKTQQDNMSSDQRKLLAHIIQIRKELEVAPSDKPLSFFYVQTSVKKRVLKSFDQEIQLLQASKNKKRFPTELKTRLETWLAQLNSRTVLAQSTNHSPTSQKHAMMPFPKQNIQVPIEKCIALQRAVEGICGAQKKRQSVPLQEKCFSIKEENKKIKNKIDFVKTWIKKKKIARNNFRELAGSDVAEELEKVLEKAEQTSSSTRQESPPKEHPTTRVSVLPSQPSVESGCQADLDAARKEAQASKARLHRVQRDLNGVRQTLKTLEGQLQQSKDRVGVFTKQTEELNKQITKLQKDLTSEQGAHRSEKKAHDNLKTLSAAQQTQLREQGKLLEHLRSEFSTLFAQVNNAHKEADNLRFHTAQYKRTHHLFSPRETYNRYPLRTADTLTLETLVEELKQATAKIRKIRNQLSQTRSTFNTRVDNYTTEIRSLKAEIKRLNEELDKKESDNKQLQKGIAQLGLQLAGIQSKLGQAKNQLSETKGKLKAEQSAHNEAKQRIERLDRRNIRFAIDTSLPLRLQKPIRRAVVDARFDGDNGCWVLRNFGVLAQRTFISSPSPKRFSRARIASQNISAMDALSSVVESTDSRRRSYAVAIFNENASVGFGVVSQGARDSLWKKVKDNNVRRVFLLWRGSQPEGLKELCNNKRFVCRQLPNSEYAITKLIQEIVSESNICEQ